LGEQVYNEEPTHHIWWG